MLKHFLGHLLPVLLDLTVSVVVVDLDDLGVMRLALKNMAT